MILSGIFKTQSQRLDIFYISKTLVFIERNYALFGTIWAWN